MARVCFCDDGCWIFGGCLDSSGYGNVRGDDGRVQKAHRVTYEYVHGMIPTDRELDHLCRTRNCVNPDHLQAVTRQKHVLLGLRNQHYGKLRCFRGHLLSGENLRVDKKGSRHCKECNRQRLARKRREIGVPERPWQTNEGRALRSWKPRKVEAKQAFSFS